MKLLLLSNSTMPDEAYLSWPLELISRFLDSGSDVLFIPYAGVGITYDAYEERVAHALAARRIVVRSVHHAANPVEAVRNAGAIAVGGGNTFQLLAELYRLKLVEPIREVVQAGAPFLGWSAGSNVACPSIKTTNDMPIVQPPSFEALSLFPFQINPHYTELTITGHGGETRLQRLSEYAKINSTPVICLPEGCAIEVRGDIAILHASHKVKFIRAGGVIESITPGIFKL